MLMMNDLPCSLMLFLKYRDECNTFLDDRPSSFPQSL